MISRIASPLVLLLTLASAPFTRSQAQAPSPATPDNSRPLPDPATLMHLVEANQKVAEATIRNYLYTTTITTIELDSHGSPRKSETTEREVFYIDATQLERTIRKNGASLTPEEQRKEAERIDKEIVKVKEKQVRHDTSPPKHTYTVTFARFLELGSFSNERRLTLRGRDTIALDYSGDPRAKTQNPLEAVIHDMTGTVFVDEQESALSRVEGHFLNSFKVAGGLLFSVAKDTAFTADWTRVNGEVWLPSAFSANGSMRALLFVSFNGRVSGSTTNYRRFKASSTLMPGIQEVDSVPPRQTQP